MVARCKPLTKDHLPLKTAFAGTKGWSLVTGFTVHVVVLALCHDWSRDWSRGSPLGTFGRAERERDPKGILER